MSYLNIIRAWKDAEYRESLTDEQRKGLPADPAGDFELTDADLALVAGALMCEQMSTTGCSHCTYSC